MTKAIILTLESVKYSGDSIGDDIRIEIEALGEYISLNKTIKNNTTRELNEKICTFRGIQASFIFPLTVRIIERDLIFNDVGIEQFKIRVDLSNFGSQKIVQIIKVVESRWPFRKPEAFFDVTFNIQVVDIFRYVRETDQGFVKVRMDDGSIESLASFLKVKYEGQEVNRDCFTILEGVFQNRTASVKLDEDGSSFLQLENEHTGPVHMIYSLSKDKLKVKGKSYNVVKEVSNSWKKGFYDVEIPDHIHELGRSYTDRARKAMVWFHIGHDPKDERYLHTGSITAGCITINEVEKWDELWNVVVRGRKRDGKSVGILEVID